MQETPFSSGNDEYVVVKVSMVPQIILSGVVLLGATVLLALMITLSGQWSSGLSIIIISIGLLFFIGVVVAILINFYNTANTYYVLGNGAIRMVKNFLFFKDEVFYTLNENSDFLLKQSMLGRFFRFGTIEVADPTGRLKMFLVNISRPQRTMNDLVTLLNHIKERQVLMVDDPVTQQETIL